ncbi:MAG: GTPase Era [Clostridia bacterium]|nr:GTPase Era [Clostridia bacterium]
MINEKTTQRTAFIAIVGRPNVGKSSILNYILGQKIAIVSSKPQTTRTRIMGVLTEAETQLVFIDTPGLHRPRNDLDRFMLRSVNESVAGVDACLLVTEAGSEIREEENQLLEKFRSMDIPAVLAINKTDMLTDKTIIARQIAELSSLYDFDGVVPCSARTGDGMNSLKNELKSLALEGEHMFDEDTLTDQPERVIAGEIIREKLLRLLSKEVPHGSAVFVERMKERPDSNIIDIDATIYCERATHKGIIIGKGGAMLKKIGTYARQDIEKFFDCKVNLQIWVKVKEDWRNRENILRSLGYDQNDFNQ